MNNLRPLAIYLPQYHCIPENDKTWGQGFTDWTNVRKTQPLFEGHYQPHIPHESLGYYDLSNPEILVKQAAMAKEHGIYGFAYYHYWFNGERLLNRPLDNMLASGMPDFPFCYIWANENWTKRWDGYDNEVIIKQEYSLSDDRAHIRFLCENVFSNKNYIKINGNPVFIVYRTGLFPNAKETAGIWRSEVRKYGYNGIYLVKVESFGNHIDPGIIDFDAAMEFPPLGSYIEETVNIKNTSLLCYDYATTVMNSLFKIPDYKLYRCVYPSWDNTARRGNNATVVVNTNPEVFKYSLRKACDYTITCMNDDERFIFINAWNEWAEGCHLEPDVRNGFTYLEICKNVLSSSFNGSNSYSHIISLNSLNKNLQNSWSYKIGSIIVRPLAKLKTFLKI
jgi:hypothetical protein